MKLSLVVIFIFIALYPINRLQSQTEIVDSYFSPIMEFYSNNYLGGYSSGRGNAGIASESGLSGVLLNPASLNLKKNSELNFQYTVKTIQPLDFLYSNSDIAMRQNWFFSGSAGIAFKINKNINAGIMYSNPSSMLFYNGEVTQSNGTSFDQYSRFHIHSIRAPISIQFKKFSLGVSFIYNIYVNVSHGLITTLENPDGTDSDVTSSISRFNMQFGAIYRPFPSFSVGVTFTPGFKSTINTFYSPIPSNISFVARYPAKGGIGLSYEVPNTNIKLYADYNYINTKVIEGYKDWHNFNIGADFNIKKNITLRGGFFTYLRPEENTDNVQFIVSPSTYNQVFLTAGATFRFKDSDLTLSLLDSHISGGKIANTYLNVSFSPQF